MAEHRRRFLAAGEAAGENLQPTVLGLAISQYAQPGKRRGGRLGACSAVRFARFVSFSFGDGVSVSKSRSFGKSLNMLLLRFFLGIC